MICMDKLTNVIGQPAVDFALLAGTSGRGLAARARLESIEAALHYRLTSSTDRTLATLLGYLPQYSHLQQQQQQQQQAEQFGQSSDQDGAVIMDLRVKKCDTGFKKEAAEELVGRISEARKSLCTTNGVDLCLSGTKNQVDPGPIEVSQRFGPINQAIDVDVGANRGSGKRCQWQDGQRNAGGWTTKATRATRRNRTMFSEWQLNELEWRFIRNKYLITSDRIRVAKMLNLNQLQVKTWFQVSEGGCCCCCGPEGKIFQKPTSAIKWATRQLLT